MKLAKQMLALFVVVVGIAEARTPFRAEFARSMEYARITSLSDGVLQRSFGSSTLYHNLKVVLPAVIKVQNACHTFEGIQIENLFNNRVRPAQKRTLVRAMSSVHPLYDVCHTGMPRPVHTKIVIPFTFKANGRLPEVILKKIELDNGFQYAVYDLRIDTLRNEVEVRARPMPIIKPHI